ncbi:TetR family transcriptional regulator [Streptomyces sp. NPDC002564]|uniref:TetR family transcriptional regulator n=1 Tax=Streptomyces sp. NPDC002564 TaxID=3364649 RepID=UPI0036A77BCE
MNQQPRATRTRTHLLDSAARLFEQHGYTNTSLDDIATGAGVSRGALHFHFPNKAALATAIDQAATQALHHTTRQLNPDPAAPALQNLIDLTHHLIRLLHTNTTVRAAFRLTTDTPTPHAPTGAATGADATTTPKANTAAPDAPATTAAPTTPAPTPAPGSHTLQHHWHTTIHHHVTQASQDRTLPPHINPHALTTTLIATTTGLEILARTNPQWTTPTPLTHLWQLLTPTA